MIVYIFIIKNIMKIKWHGHSCFTIISNNGKRLLIDPYNEKIGYKVPEFRADYILITHDHHDHSNVDAVTGKYEIIKGYGSWKKGEFDIEGIKTYHDKNNGLDRGENTVFIIKVDGKKVCHCGDLGHILDKKTVKKIGKVDVLLIPIGGTYTIDVEEANIIDKMIEPKVLIPMHYKTEDCIVELDKIDDFLTLYRDNNVEFLDNNILEFKKEYPKEHVVVMKY